MSQHVPEDPRKKTGTDTDPLSEEELASLAGAMPNKTTNDDCKTTTDTGIGGCPG